MFTCHNLHSNRTLINFFQAGIEKQNLTLALEPEGAAMCCKYLALEKQERGDATELKTFEEGSKFIVVDLGGNHLITNKYNYKFL